MSNINKVILIGRLGRDPEVRHLENGLTVAKLAIATTESYKDKTSGEWIEQTEWHEVVMWRFLAERAEKTLKKGALVYVEGKLKHRKYQKEGEETARRISEIVADNFRLLSKREDATGIQTGNVDTSVNLDKPAKVATEYPAEDPADDLPF